jgi:hypothetical protein
MSINVDLPDLLSRSLSAKAAMLSTCWRDHTLQLIEREMCAPELSQMKREPRPIPAIAEVDFGPVLLELTTKRDINKSLADEEFQIYLNVIKCGRYAGKAPMKNVNRVRDFTSDLPFESGQRLRGDLADINIWLTLSHADHPHHTIAKAY